MKKEVSCMGLVVIMVASLVLSAPAQSMSKHGAQAPSIEGTYRLVSRVLADGTVKKVPEVMGLLTYTKNLRNFNVYWTGENGKVFSYSMISKYSLTANEYTETVQLSIMNDEIGGKAIAYDLSKPSKTVPVSMVGDRLMMKLPFDPVTVTFDGHTMMGKGADFTDTWERVE